MATVSEFDALSEQLNHGGAEAMFARLTEQLRQQRKYHELFDARLMQARHRLGLPIVLTGSLDDLPEPLRTQVEDAYLAACKEVGMLLLDEGRVRDSWLYLRPVGDLNTVSERLRAIEVDEDNIQEIVDVALHEGVCPSFGFQLVLENFGTCNAITSFEANMTRRGGTDQQQAAAMLVRHLHRELVHNVRHDIKRQEGAEPRETTLRELVADRDWLFANNNYHIDTTHLNSVVRFARVLEDREVIRLAQDLTEYGRRLSSQYHFESEEPFSDPYVHGGLFLSAQLGEQVDEAIEYFRAKADATDAHHEGTAAAEAYLGLLARLGRATEALEETLRLLPYGERTSGFAPTLLELARQAGNYDRLLEVSREKGDLLGYTAALMEREGRK